MFSNYLKIGWRNIRRNKVYSFINVLGLAMGICACIVIYLITGYDLSFDKFHPDGDRIYRIVGEFQQGSGEKIFLIALLVMLPVFKIKYRDLRPLQGFIYIVRVSAYLMVTILRRNLAAG